MKRLKIWMLPSFKDGQEKPTGLLSIPRSSIVDTIPLNILKTGIHEAVLRIKDFPVQFGWQLVPEFLVKEKVKGTCHHEAAPDRYLAGIVWGINIFSSTIREVARTQYQGFKRLHLILLNSVRSAKFRAHWWIQQIHWNWRKSYITAR